MRAVLMALPLLWVLGLLPYEVTANLDLHAGGHGRSTSDRNTPHLSTNVKVLPNEVQAEADEAVDDAKKDPVNHIADHFDSHLDKTGLKVEGNIDSATSKMAEENDDTASTQPVAYKHRERLLTASDLHPIQSIECLEKMQRGEIDEKCLPKEEKEKKEKEKKEKKEGKKGPQQFEGPPPAAYSKRNTWWVSHYPHFKSEQCHGHGEHFCDPDDLLNETERCKVAQELNRFARNHDVLCDVPGTGNQERYPFFLGVALVRKMPDLLLDKSSMNHFGEGVLAEWGLLEDRTCPNSAVIVISKESNEATLASSSCEFICEERGGEGINIRVKETLTLGGSTFTAVMGGIREFGTVLRRESPLYQEPGVGLPAKKAMLSKDFTDKIDGAEMTLEEMTGGYEVHEAEAARKDRKDLATYLAHREASYALVQRAVFGIIIGSALVTIIYLCYYAYSGDVFMVYKKFQDDLTPEYVVPELMKGPPKWGYESSSYGSFHSESAY